MITRIIAGIFLIQFLQLNQFHMIADQNMIDRQILLKERSDLSSQSGTDGRINRVFEMIFLNQIGRQVFQRRVEITGDNGERTFLVFLNQINQDFRLSDSDRFQVVVKVGIEEGEILLFCFVRRSKNSRGR